LKFLFRNVSCDCNFSVEQALDESYNNAEKAKANAQEAQERYADQASKV
jgi:hypothetical protein